MNKKIVSIMMLTFFCISCAGLSVFAANDADYREYASLFDSKELELIDNVINNSTLFGEKTDNADSENALADNTAYKQYSLYADELIAADADGKKLNNYLSDTYCWIVENSGCFVKVVFKDGEWQAIGYTTYPDDSKNTDIIDIDDFEQKLSMLQSENKDETVDVVFFKIEQIYTSFAYMSAGENEYLIPYGSRPDFTGLENGKLYTVAEVADKLIDASAENDAASDKNAGGFSSVSDPDSNNGAKYIIITVCIGIVLLFTMFIFIRKRNSKSI